jgi:SAM-dependent methyltransferase
MSERASEMKATWETSFAAQIAASAYNTAPVEAVVRAVAYYLRARHAPEEYARLRFLDLGCGAGPNMVWLAEKGIRVSGIDIAPTAVRLARENLERHNFSARLDELVTGSVTALPFEDQKFDGAVEACVFQHLERADRARAFAEVRRVLKPGGVFVGYMLSQSHTVFREKPELVLADDPGTLVLRDSGPSASSYHLTNIGLSHFFSRSEFGTLLEGFGTVDPCASDYDIPSEEAKRRGYARYRQGMWTVYAVK